MKQTQANIYLDGTMIMILGQSGQILRSEPRGNLKVRPFDTAGLIFYALDQGTEVLIVEDFNNVLDGSGDPHGSTRTETISALNQFLAFKKGGGGEHVFDEQKDSEDSADSGFTTRHSYTAEMEPGTYLVEAYIHLQLQSGDGLLVAILDIDSSRAVGYTASVLADDTEVFYLRYFVTLTDGSHSFVAKFRRTTPATTAICVFSNLSIQKVT